MKKINKKVLIFASLLLIIPILIILIGRTTDFFSNATKDDKLAGTEIELDNWELSIVFYDSKVNDGKTPLTEIDWDASDGGYKEQSARKITIQINYRNTNTVNEYKAGSLSINLDKLFATTNLSFNWGTSFSFYSVNTKVGANNYSGTSYDWNYDSGYKSYWHFTNANKIEKNANLEGTIQVVYTITPASHTEEGKDSTFVEENKKIKATLKDITSNELSYHYKRLYEHPWIKQQFTLKKTASKLLSLDGLPINHDDYIWVKYGIGQTQNYVGSHYSYPTLSASKGYIYDTNIPEDCLVLDEKMNTLTREENGYYKFTYSGEKYIYIYVGYPKATYNTLNSNMELTNKADLYVQYYGESDYVLASHAEVNIDLSNFVFNYGTPKYNISTQFDSTSTVSASALYGEHNQTYYQTITSDKKMGVNPVPEKDTVTISYTGKPMNAQIGNDLLYIQKKDGTYKKLTEKDYYVSSVVIPALKNGNNISTVEGKYDIEIYIKQENQDEYKLFTTTTNKTSSQTISIPPEEKATAYYILIKNITEDINGTAFMAYYKFKIDTSNDDIPKKGEIRNYPYLKVYIEGNLQNKATNYSFTNSTEIKKYELEKNGFLSVRVSSSDPYDEYVLENTVAYLPTYKYMPEPSRNQTNEEYTGYANIGLATVQDDYIYPDRIKDWGDEEYIKNNTILGYEFYDLLPKGMELTSTKEEILNSFFDPQPSWTMFWAYDENCNQIPKNDFLNLIKENTTLEIIENYKNTGRTFLHIKIDMTEHPFFIEFYSVNGYGIFGFRYYYKISYDSILEYGNNFNNGLYAKFYNREFDTYGFRTGTWGYVNVAVDVNDFDNDGSKNDYLTYDNYSIIIDDPVSTQQDVQTSVQTNKNNYDTSKVEASNNSNYNYKLRVRSGVNDITNLVIYNSIEKYAKNSAQEFINSSGSNNKWQGEFLGVDTSYAKSKGYNVKVWYSELDKPGSLKDDTSWQEYSETIDKTKVKTLAFEYLDNEGNPAVIPQNSLTYVLINMKSPSTDYKTFAYNGCWTEWNALDPVTKTPVDFVTGINSNIVKIGLPSSVEPEDIELTLTKKWEDNENSLSLRPSSVKFKIISNEDYTNPLEVSLTGTGNTWTTKVSVPKYDAAGEEIEYTIKEDTINLENNYKYVPTIDDYNITNTLEKNLIVTKNWLDNTNAYLTRPSNIVIKIYQNGDFYDNLTITGAYNTNTWTGSISVPIFDNKGNEYTYTIEEIEIENYISNCKEFTCTNTLAKNTTISINKEWVDDNNVNNTRPDSINVYLKQNGLYYKTININSTDSWESGEIEVPLYDSNGVKYSYTLEEQLAEHYDQVTYDNVNYKLTNTLKENKTIKITKKWLDNNNAYSTRPENLKITLLQNNNEYKEITLTGTTDTWIEEIEVPKYDNNQREYIYSIKELNDNIKDEYSDITYSENDLSVTNKLKKKTNLTITKKWLDHDNEYLTRPETIELIVLRNGEEYRNVSLTGTTNTWTYTLEDVDVYDENAKKYIYTIKEIESIDKYDKTTIDQSNLTITNELTEIPKVTVYITLKLGYVDPETKKIKYDEEGINSILQKHNVDPAKEFTFDFSLKNVETDETYEGKINSKGVLELNEIPYGKYEMIEETDGLFEFVNMLNIEEVLGVSFEQTKNGGVLTIKPNGDNIIYGINVTNKIGIPEKNPNTSTSLVKILKILVILTISLVIALFAFNQYKKNTI